MATNDGRMIVRSLFVTELDEACLIRDAAIRADRKARKVTDGR